MSVRNVHLEVNISTAGITCGPPTTVLAVEIPALHLCFRNDSQNDMRCTLLSNLGKRDHGSACSHKQSQLAWMGWSFNAITVLLPSYNIKLISLNPLIWVVWTALKQTKTKKKKKKKKKGKETMPILGIIKRKRVSSEGSYSKASIWTPGQKITSTNRRRKKQREE